MTGFVLDNSVTMRWCFEEMSNAYAEDVLERMAAGEAAIVPVLWRYELGAVLAKAERKGTVTAQKAADFVAATRFLNITIDHDGIDQVQTEVYRLAVAWRRAGWRSSEHDGSPPAMGLGGTAVPPRGRRRAPRGRKSRAWRVS